jgi:hypothetical protein
MHARLSGRMGAQGRKLADATNLCRSSSRSKLIAIVERPVARATRVMTKAFSKEAQPAPISGIIQAFFMTIWKRN